MNKTSNKREDKIFISICILGLFSFVFLFFTVIHPLVVFDGDDWCYLSQFRKPIPIWGYWNPGRVLPETFLPLLGYISAYVVNPFIGNYLLSITTVFSLSIAIFCVILYVLFSKFLVTAMGIEIKKSYSIALVWICFYFLLFKSQNANNIYVLFATNLICYYYYVVPSLLNSSLVLYFMLHQNDNHFFDDFSYIHKGILLIVIYFAVFSNVFNSIIVAIYCGVYLFVDFVKQGKLNKSAMLASMHKDSIQWITLLMWVIQIVFEMTGGRAAAIGKSVSYLHLPLYETGVSFYHLLKLVNSQCAIFCVLCIVLALVLALRHKQEVSCRYHIDTMIHLVLSGILISIFLLLVCAKANVAYAGWIQCMYGIFFYFLLCAFISLTFIINRFKTLEMLIPFILIFSIVVATSSDKPYRDANMLNLNPVKAYAVSNYLIDQIKTADMNGDTELNLIVPKGDNVDNWPFPNYMGRNISRTLYTHGQTSKMMKINIIADPSLNELLYNKIL